MSSDVKCGIVHLKEKTRNASNIWWLFINETYDIGMVLTRPQESRWRTATYMS